MATQCAIASIAAPGQLKDDAARCQSGRDLALMDCYMPCNNVGDAIVLSIRNLTKTYLAGNEPVSVLRGVDLDVTAGERVALTGESGSGKSTLLHLIAGLDTADTGYFYLVGARLGMLD